MAIYMWREHIPQELCFTANTAGSTVKLTKTWSPTAVTLETSTDGGIRTTYTIWDTITLSNIGDKVYWRNTSETTTGFGTASNSYYVFAMTWSIAASWDVTSLINKNCTDTLNWSYCFHRLFQNCTSLVSCPKLLATTLTENCYQAMFYQCTNLETLPNLPATSLTTSCYASMFSGCSKIKISGTQGGIYQTPYRIPTEWTWTSGSGSLGYIFQYTWWTKTWSAAINTTYYTSNTIV